MTAKKPDLPEPNVQNFPSGKWSFHRTQIEAYGDACIAYGRAQGRAELVEALKTIADMCPATQEFTLASSMGQIALDALRKEPK